ncbi:hypothetical protein EDB84DRAFT_1437563 [Lactarius hengduanensis]|nr:hypothetical protein EDB84DRAFT_1437563 [Lactarius hengduanensis]
MPYQRDWLEYQLPTRRSDEGEQDGEVSKDSICAVGSGLTVLEVDLGVLQCTDNEVDIMMNRPALGCLIMMFQNETSVVMIPTKRENMEFEKVVMSSLIIDNHLVKLYFRNPYFLKGGIQSEAKSCKDQSKGHAELGLGDGRSKECTRREEGVREIKPRLFDPQDYEQRYNNKGSSTIIPKKCRNRGTRDGIQKNISILRIKVVRYVNSLTGDTRD